ncbi:hypothetical protein [Altericista sp. CCNU0014]|uniref:hypothetical protein n=1 Tax=Altericista sp. CCNU0014 TaxID=3082949 RepID=UPI00384E3398
MSNPNPVIPDKFRAAMYRPKYPDDPLSKQAIAIRFRGSVDAKLRSIPEYSTLIRDAVDEYFTRLESPVTSALQQPQSDIPLPALEDDGRPMEKVGARVPAVVSEAIATVPNRTEWLRRVITEAAQRELMKGGES